MKCGDLAFLPTPGRYRRMAVECEREAGHEANDRLTWRVPRVLPAIGPVRHRFRLNDAEAVVWDEAGEGGVVRYDPFAPP